MMNAIRRFLRLLWIEIQRSQAAPVAVLGFVLAWLLHDATQGVVIWNDISQSVVDAHLFMAPLGAAIAVWSVARTNRRGVNEQEKALPTPAGSSDLIISLAVMIWMIAAYTGFFIVLAVPGWRFATWGGPNLPLILIGASAICAGVAIGSLISLLGRSAVLAPVTLIAIYGAMVYVSDSLWYSDAARLVPIKFLEDNGFNFNVRQPVDDFLVYCVWMVALTVTLVLLQLLLRSRSTIRIGATALSIAVALLSANRVVAEPARERWPDPIPVTPVCETASQFEVCVHPAFETLLDDVVAEVNTIAPNFVGLSGLPATLYQAEAVTPIGSDVTVFYLWDETTIDFSIPEMFLDFAHVPASGNDGSGVNASQCAVGMALAGLSGEFHHCAFEIVFESGGALSTAIDEQSVYIPDQPRVEEESRMINAKAESFAALSPEARQAWLDENWDALRAGDLELEDLP